MEIYISTDIETTGLHPTHSSMISLGSAAFLADGRMVDTFEINIKEKKWWLPERYRPRNKETMDWWNKSEQREAWEYIRKDLVSPYIAMWKYYRWLSRIRIDHTINGVPSLVFVGYRADFDFQFVQYYLGKYIKVHPFGFSALDMNVYAMAVLKYKEFRMSRKKHYPKRWKVNNPKQHTALSDAIEQGYIFINMFKENLSNK